MNEKVRNIGTQALLTAFGFALVVFVSLAAILVYQNFELARRIDSVIQTQAQIRAELHELQREVARLNSFFSPEGIKKMSLKMKRFDHLNDGKANYYAALIYAFSKQHELDPYLVYSIIHIESSFVSTAVSPKGARGLMQVMPSWSATFNISLDDLFHPATNIRVGTAILRDELKRRRTVQKALAAYNAGKGDGTGQYVKKVMGVYKKL